MKTWAPVMRSFGMSLNIADKREEE